MSLFASELPSSVAAAMWSVIDRAAQLARTAGDDRPIGLLRAEAHATLVLDPGGTAGPAFTGHVTVLAPLPALGRPRDHRGAGNPCRPPGLRRAVRCHG
ncbi:hypothetical protein [Blastococcus sp. SYSU DS0973]